MSKIKGIIFDMDGTLVDSIGAHYDAWKKAFAKYGLEMTREYFDKVNGMSTPKIAELVVDEFKLQIEPKELSDEKRRVVNDILLRGTEVYNGVDNALITLKRLGYHLALGTSSIRNHMEIEMGTHLNTIEFDSLITADDVENAKPAPDIYLKSAELLGFKPEECIVVEDAINGVKAAKAAGMKCIAVTTTTPRQKLVDAGANAIISSIDKISSRLIEQIENLETETNGEK